MAEENVTLETTQLLSPLVRDAADKKIDVLTKQPIISSVLKQLDELLPETLPFHSIDHTRDVLREAVLFAINEKRSERELELLAIAAAYHDVGFLEQMDDNEEIGARTAVAAMGEAGGYSEEEIELVKRMILDTKLHPVGESYQQKANTPLSKYLLDADLSNFGREDFFKMLEWRRQELEQEPDVVFARTLGLMQNHSWQTKTAERIRQPKKLENIRKLEKLIDGEEPF